MDQLRGTTTPCRNGDISADGVKTYESTLRQHYEYIRQWDAAQGDYVVVDSVPRSQTD